MFHSGLKPSRATAASCGVVASTLRVPCIGAGFLCPAPKRFENAYYRPTSSIRKRLSLQRCRSKVCRQDDRRRATRVFSWTPLRWFGNISYSCYLVHGLALFLAVGRRFSLAVPGGCRRPEDSRVASVSRLYFRRKSPPAF